MKWPMRLVLNALVLLVLATVPVHSFGQENQPAQAVPSSEAATPAEGLSAIEDLGDERYRIGAITVDKAARSFTVAGKVLQLNRPLEYLAVMRDGYKGYESLLELDTSAVEFTLACILLGLDEERSVKPRYQFDRREVEGQALEITIDWKAEGATKTLSAASALMAGDQPFDDDQWVYVGSTTSPKDGRLLAEASGTLIGFVHDPLSIIEHRVGAGFGAYGMMTGNSAVLPPLGAPVTLTVAVIAK